MPLPPALTSRLLRLRERLAVGQRRAESGGDPLVWAAVAVVLAPDPDSILLIRRAERRGDPWSGHMALPGGRRGSDDADLVATAIRETFEEVGLALERDQLAGILDDVAPRTPILPPIAIRPFVFALPARAALIPNAEVAATRWVRLDELGHPETHRIVRVEVRGEEREVPAYVLGDATVWGLTESVIASLLRQLRP